MCMIINPLKRNIEESDISTIASENKKLRPSLSTCIAEAIFSSSMSNYATPVVEQVLESAPGMLNHAVVYNQKYDFVTVKLDDNRLCLASKSLGDGHNNVVRKAVIVDLNAEVIIDDRIKLRHSPPPTAKQRRVKVSNNEEALSLIRKINHTNITPAPSFYETLPVSIRGREYRMHFAIEPLFDDVSHKFKFNSAQQIQKYAQETADALRYLHSRNILHRNVRADNVAIHNNQAILMDWDTLIIANDTKENRREFQLKDRSTIALDSFASERLQLGYLIQNWLHLFIKNSGSEYSYISRNEIQDELCLKLYEQAEALIAGDTLDNVFPPISNQDLQV